jgi:hypothetical protein
VVAPGDGVLICAEPTWVIYTASDLNPLAIGCAGLLLFIPPPADDLAVLCQSRCMDPVGEALGVHICLDGAVLAFCVTSQAYTPAAASEPQR